MAVSIVPTFDFAFDAVPTRATLLQQALSLSVTGLDLLSLDSSILGIVGGTVSGSTNAMQAGVSAVGSMWIDGGGNIWVHEQSGPVMLSRFHGGWETRRYLVRSGTSGLPVTNRPGTGAGQHLGGPNQDWRRAFGSTVVTDTATTWQVDDEGMDDNDSGRLNGFIQETCTSNYIRVCGRGITILFDVSNTDNVAVASMRNNYRVARNDTLSLAKESFHGTVLTSTRQQAVILSPAVNSSVVSQAGGNHQIKTFYMGWNFGVFQRGKVAFS